MAQTNQHNNRKLFYFLLALAFLRPCLDIIGRYEFRLHRSLPGLTLNILLGALVFIVTVFFLLKNIRSVFKIPLFWPILVLLALFFASFFYSIDPSSGLKDFTQVASFLFLYLAAYLAVSEKRDLILFFRIILLSYVLPGLFAGFQLLLGKGMPDDWGGFNRIYGTFSHPNQFAFYTFFILTLVLSLILASLEKKKIATPSETEKIIPFYFLYPIAFFIFIFLFLTYSRSALASLCIAVFIFGVFKYRRLLLIGLLIFLTLYVFSEPFQERIWDLITLEPTSSVVWRFKMWNDILPVALWEPWLGHGIGTYPLLAEFYRGVMHGSTDAHNDYLKVFTENGALGLTAYLWLMGTLLYYLFKIFLKSEAGRRTLALGILVIQISLLATAFFDNVLEATALQWNLWMFLGAWLKCYGGPSQTEKIKG